MIIQSAWQLSFDFFGSTAVVVEPSAAQVSSDAGLLPFRQLDEQFGLTRQFAEALIDRRHGSYVGHTFLEMTRARIYGILADYADQNDHDVLRSDPIFKLICGRSINDDDLASQPTLSRFENAIGPKSFFALQDMFLDQFIASFDKPPTHLTLDIDPFDDPTHGQQQLTFFHGYYEQYQYLPRVITCAENDLVLTVCLLHGTAHATLGAQDDLAYVVGRLRKVWPDVQIHLRGDSGFGTPTMYAACEQLNIDYTLGIGMNATLKKWTRFPAGRGGGRVGQDERTATLVHRLLVSSPVLARPTLGGREVRGQCPGHEPTGRGHQSPGSVRPARRRLRRLRRPRRKREPQQGTQTRVAGRSAQRSPLLRQSLPPLSPRGGLQSAGSHAARYGGSATCVATPAKCRPKPSAESNVATGTTAAASTIPWAKASLAPGGHG